MNEAMQTPPSPFSNPHNQPSSTTQEFVNTSRPNALNSDDNNFQLELEGSSSKVRLLAALSVVLALVWVVLSHSIPISAVFACFGSFALSISVMLFLVVATCLHGVRKLNKNQIVLLVLSLAMSAVPAITGSMLVRFSHAFMLAFTCMLYLRALADPASDPLSSPLASLGAVGSFFVEQFAHIKTVWNSLISSSGKPTSAREASHQTVAILLGLAVAALVLLLVFPILQMANPIFSGLTESWFSQVQNLFSTTAVWGVVRLVLITPLAASLFWSCTFGAKAKTNARSAGTTFTGIPELSALIVLGVLDVVYLVWCASDVYFLMNTQLERAFVSFEARSSFFQLLVVLLINLSVLCLCVAPTTHSDAASSVENPVAQASKSKLATGRKTAAFLLVACTVGLLTSTLFRLCSYIQAYGLTLARIYAAWALVLIGFLLVLWVIKLVRPDLRIFKPALVGTLVFWCAFVLVRPAKICADYNVSRYMEGSLADLDIYDFGEVWSDSRSALERLANSDLPLANEARFQLEANEYQTGLEIPYVTTIFDALSGHPFM